MSEELKDFCKNYEVRVLNDQKYRARYHPPKFFTIPERADIIRNDIVEYEKERVFTVEIPEGRFNALVEMERRFFKWHHHNQGEIDMFQTLMDKEREELHYRHTNEAVKKAYEQYSLMLNLAGYQRKF
jgi:CRISPR/Cas system CMR-associated protein Cmr1 (group 7 of RAMP superfamily)